MFHGIRNEEDRKFFDEALKRFVQMFPRVFAADNVILFGRTLGFQHDAKFMGAYRGNARNNQDRSLVLRLHTLAWAARQALHIAGDFIECGVFRGFSSSVIADYLDFDTLMRTYYLYDTFDGIPPALDPEKHDHPLYHEAGLYESVQARFARYPNVRIVRGPVPDSFAQACPREIAFLHLDLNSSTAETAALDVLFDRVSVGGVIVFDDYGWTGYESQHNAANAFAEKRQHMILELATGQGLLVKHA
jgi:O-methyltransferase